MRTIIVLCFMLACLAGCAAKDNPTPAPASTPASAHIQPEANATLTVQGEVMYRERMALPPRAELWVQLVELDGKGRTLTVLAEQRDAIGKRGIPLPFTLQTAARAIRPDARYGIYARIMEGKRSLFANAEATPLILGADGTPEAARIMLHRTMAEKVKAAPPAPKALTGKLWELRELYGAPVERFDNQRLPSIAVHPAEARISGTDGCNRITAGYTHKGSEVHFKSMASTMMACPQGGEQSRSFASALAEADNWLHKGEKLILRRFDRIIAVLESVSL